MRRIVLRVWAVVAMAAVVVGLAGAPAHAGGWHVEPVGDVTATSTDFEISIGGSVYTCEEAVIEGEIELDAGGQFGTFDDGVWTNCTDSVSTCTVTFIGLWKIQALTHTGEIVHVKITDFELDFTGPSCTGTVDAEVEGIYNTLESKLTIELPATGGSPGVSGSFVFEPGISIYKFWDVDPEGAFEAESDNFSFYYDSLEYRCETVFLEGEVFNSSSDHVGYIHDVELDNCSSGYSGSCDGALSLSTELYADEQIGNLVHVRIVSFWISFQGFFCPLAISGSAYGTYDNSTSTLTLEWRPGGMLVSGTFPVYPSITISGL